MDKIICKRVLINTLFLCLSLTVGFMISSIVWTAESVAVDIAYVMSKKKPLDAHIVFVHGTPGDSGAFLDYLESVKLQSKFNMMSVDRLGFGKSGKEPELSFDKQTEAIVAAVEKEFPGRQVMCVGHSYGGPLCLKLSMDRPDIFYKIISVSGAFNGHRKIVKWYNRLASLSLVKWIIPKALENGNKEMYNLKKQLLKLETKFKDLKTEVKIIHGVKDKIVPVGDADWLYDKIKSDKVVYKRVEGVGHFVLWKRFGLIENEILNFL